MKNNSVFISKPVVVRSPLLRPSPKMNRHFANYDFYIKNHKLMLAIKNHSPQFYKKAIAAYKMKDRCKEKEFLPVLQKYFIRASSHNVPRGLFAGYEFPSRFLKKKRAEQLNYIQKIKAQEHFIVNSTIKFYSKNNMVTAKFNLKNKWIQSSLHLDYQIFNNLKNFCLGCSKRALTKNQILKLIEIKSSMQGEHAWNSFVKAGLFLKTDISRFNAKYSGYMVKKTSFQNKLFSGLAELEVQCDTDNMELTVNSEQANDLKIAVQFLTKLYLNTPKRFMCEYLASDFVIDMKNQSLDFHAFVSWLQQKQLSAPVVYLEKKTSLVMDSLRNIFGVITGGGDLKKSIRELEILSGSLPYPPISVEPVIGLLFLQKLKNGEVFLDSLLGGSASKVLSRHTFYSEEARKKILLLLQEEEKIFGTDYFQIVNGETDRGLDEINSHALNYSKNILLNCPTFGSQDLHINDIRVHSDGRNFILINGNSGRVIKPFVSNLWQWHTSGNVYFRALCLIATQEEIGFESLGAFLFGYNDNWPRVQFGSCILVPKRWYINRKSDLDKLRNGNMPCDFPETFYLIRGDRRLFINMTNDGMRSFFKEIVKSLEAFQIEEVLENSNCWGYSKRVIYPFKTKIPSKLGGIKPPDSYILKDAYFGIQGQRRVYFKIYIDFESMDLFISQVLKDYFRRVGRNKNNSFFFVRYFDEGAHLRVRFIFSRLDGPSKKIISDFTEKLEKQIKNKNIINYKIEHYFPEYLRYGGGKGVELMHRHAHRQSILFINIKDRQKYLSSDLGYLYVAYLIQLYLETFFEKTAKRIQYLESKVYSKNIKAWHKQPPINHKLFYNNMEKTKKSERSKKIIISFQKEIKFFKNQLNQCIADGKINVSSEEFLFNLTHLLCNRFGIISKNIEYKLYRQLLAYNHILKSLDNECGGAQHRGCNEKEEEK